MIFVTCGSSLLPFNRMMDALQALPAERLCVQHGPARCPPCAEAHSYMPFEEVLAKMACADAVVCHAGVGSIICAIRQGHVPVVFPRLKRYHEAVDDHQAELAQALARRGTVVVASSGEELAAAAAAPRRAVVSGEGGSMLALAVRAALRAEARGSRSRSPRDRGRALRGHERGGDAAPDGLASLEHSDHAL